LAEDISDSQFTFNFGFKIITLKSRLFAPIFKLLSFPVITEADYNSTSLVQFNQSARIFFNPP